MSLTAELVSTINNNSLPDGWTICTIEDLVGEDGVFVDGDWVESKDQDPEGNVRLIQLADIGDGEYRNKSSRFLTHERALKLGCTFLEKGDVLIARMPDPLGRACVFPGDLKKSVTAVDVAIIRPAPNAFNNRWLMYFVNAPAFRSAVASLQSGSTRKRISRKNLARICLPVPPREQQNRIVAEIEKQFSRLDEAVANLKRVKANLKRYKAAVLKAAVEGKLTEDWRKAHPDVEPASELLKRILAEHRAKWEHAELAKMKAAGKESKDDKWKKHYKEPDSIRTDDIYDIPKFWTWANLGQLSWSVKDGPHYSPKYATTGIPFITGGNIRPEGIDFSSAKYISLQLHADLSERCKPEVGDLLYTKGGTTGIARINTEKREFNVWVHVAVLKLVDSIEPFYLQHSLNSPHCYRQSQRYTHGVGNQDLGLTRMIWITIPLPPFQEQTQILQEIESRISVVKAIEKQADSNLSRAERLRQSILSMAFCGRLVLASGALSPPSIWESQRHANYVP